VPGYSCDPAKCTSAAKCQCPSNAAPGGLATADVPQFVLISHDDAISATADRAVRSITDPHKNSNGCNVPATWFVTETGTDCALVKKLWEQNHEMALHTVNHAQLLPNLKGIEQEMLGVRTFLNTQCGIPLTDLVGFRSPFLIHNPTVRSILAKNNILYDSTMVEYISDTSPTSKSFSQRMWPYTFDNGIPQDCNWTYPSGQCTQTEKYPGMWEVPMYDLPNSTVTPQINAYTMDPAGGFGGDLVTLFKTNFDQAYNGNRAPFPIFVHAPWLTPANIAATNTFIEYALSKPNVFFVTIKQLVEWMANPVPASQLATTLKCNPTDLKAPTAPPPCLKYTVETGDYIDLISGKHGVPTEDLLKLNPGLSTNIQPGQVVKIPPWDPKCDTPDGAAALLAEFEAAANAPQPTAAPLAPVAAVPVVPAAEALPTAPVVPATTVVPPSTVSGPPDRVDMEVTLQGTDEATFKTQGQNHVINTLSQLLETFPDRISLTATPVVARRRSRNLLQEVPTAAATTMAATTPTTTTPAPVVAAGPAPNALKVNAMIISEDPVATYVKLDQEIKEGEFESLLNALGLTAVSTPTLVAYKGGVKIEDPAAVAAASGTTPVTTSSSSSSGLSTPVVIGIAVGAGVLVLAAVLTTVLCVRRKRAAARKTDLAASKNKNDGQFMFHADSRHVGAAASLKVKTNQPKGSGSNGGSGASSIKDDDSVVKGDTPTSATYRANAANNAFRV
jgi:LysM repeat protein/peptidoglycan/xylan/chitin deacetylase (PgdA/CDA1 family)